MSITSKAQPDTSKHFILTTDASSVAIGAVLSQLNHEGRKKVIHCYSRCLTDAEKNYSVTDKELLAAVKGIQNYRHYLLGKTFTLETNHKVLEFLHTCKNDNSRLLRWAMTLQEYSFIPKYICGETNSADGLSRQVFNLCKANKANQLQAHDKQLILQDYHTTSGHGSLANMQFLLKGKYNWKGRKNDIKQMIEKCTTCNKSGGQIINTLNKPITTQYTNELWEIDLIGPLKGSDEKNKYILVAIDHFSKWVEAKILKEKTAINTCQAINEIIEKNGSPTTILTDNGLEFKNKHINELQTKYGMSWRYGSPHHHQTTGAVERVNQTLLRKLRKLNDYNEINWERHINNAVLAVNISLHRALGTSPYIFKFGRTFKTNTDGIFKTKQISFSKSETVENKLEKWETYASKAIKKGKILDSRQFNIGDLVWVYQGANSNKLSSQWKKGFKITSFGEFGNFEVTDGTQKLVVNKKRMKLDTSQ